MINLRIQTEFHFDFSDRGYGKLPDVVARVKAMKQSAGCITDATTFGHIQWFKECTKAGVKPLLGAQIRVPTDEGNFKVALIARNNDGLQELYGLTSLAASDEMELEVLLKSSADVLKLSGALIVTPKMVKGLAKKGWYNDVSPSTPPELLAAKMAVALPVLATSDNRYMSVDDKSAFALFGGSVEGHAQHLLSEREARAYLKGLPDSAFTLSDQIAKDCTVTLPVAQNMKVKGDLEKICRDNRKARLGRWTQRYEDRLTLELKMIREKKFEDYFLIISDMVRYAKKFMVVGPARGSAAGSLVCFLADITDIDPIKHGLLFERFIDVTRADLPDIDLDFPDTKREMVIRYLQERYGADNVVHLGTTLTFQPRSILGLVGKKLSIRPYEFQPLLSSMIERSSGDSRAALCLLDTLEGMDAGRAILQKYPQVRVATAFEGHANTTGTHAAGIIVCAEPVKRYCTVDSRSATAQIDKGDAEKINLLKIDILGLRTLSVLEYCLEQLKHRTEETKRRGIRIREIEDKRMVWADLSRIPLEDKAAFDVINRGRWAGIFQFEGDAVQMLTKQIKVESFSDISALGALARPGPLNSGGASSWADRRMGREAIKHLHPLVEEFTVETYGIIIYQEQVMSIGRKIGQLDWDDVTELRKAMSKSKGEEFFNQYYEKFERGAVKHGLTAKQSRHIWDHLNTMGSWSFNKSHSVAYGLISYWCAYMKAHYPLEFAAATLRHAKDEYQTINLLRELTEDGIKYVAFDPKTSRENWEVIDGRLTGGFINIKGVGETTATELVSTRGNWTDKQKEKIATAEVLYGDVFPLRTRYGALYKNPGLGGFTNRVKKFWTARELDEGRTKDTLPGEFFFIARLSDKVPRHLNEYQFQVKRMAEGKPKELTGPIDYLNLVAEDDTGRIYATVNNKVYEEVGKPIVETGVVGESYYVFAGRLNFINRINITWAKDITQEAYPL